MNRGKHRLQDAKRSTTPYRTIHWMTTGQPILAYHWRVKFWPTGGGGPVLACISDGLGVVIP